MAIDQVKSGIAIFDISDHLPVFTVIKTSCNRIQDTLYYRDYRTFKQEDFLSELTQINWDENLRHLNNTIHQSTKNIINHIERVTQRHAPMKEVSQSKLKQLNKPWITNGILKSIKVKQRMYRTHFYSNDTSKVTQYKRYANKLNRIKSISKLRYYNNQFDKCN
jgi:transcriptional regulator with PAS, ATPase and Fis domain